MIRKLVIRGFRGIRRGRLEGLRKINLLVGPNNAGKSAVLEALYLAGTADREGSLTVSDDERSETFSVGLPRKDMLGRRPFDHLANRYTTAPDIKIHNRPDPNIIQVDFPNGDKDVSAFDLTASKEPFTEQEDPPKLFRLPPPDPGQAIRQTDIANQLSDQEIENWPEDQHLAVCWQRELSYFNQSRASWLIRGNLPPARHVIHHDMHSVQEHFPATYYQDMLAVVPGWTQRIAGHFAEIFNLDYSFSILFLPTGQSGGQNVQGWVAPVDAAALPIDAWGDGARAAFKLLTPLTALAERATDEMPGLVLWEEPELFQHPESQGKLLREVVDVVKDKPIQLFMVSHNLDVIAHLHMMLQDGSCSADEIIVFLLQLREGELQPTWFDTDNVRSWLESGMDPRVWGDFVSPSRFRCPVEMDE